MISIAKKNVLKLGVEEHPNFTIQIKINIHFPLQLNFDHH